MNNQSRLLVFFVLSAVILFGSQFAFEKLGLVTPPPKAAAKKADIKPLPKEGPEVAQAKPEDGKEKEEKKEAPPAQLEGPKEPQVEAVEPHLLVLGSEPEGPTGNETLPVFPQPNGERIPQRDRFWLRVGLDQHGGSVAWAESTYIVAERKGREKPGRFQFIRPE